MTNEQAQIIIGNIPIDGQDECYSIAEYQEAKTMAIKALEQEPKTEDDAISRQAAIKNVAQIAKVVAKSDKQKSLCGRIIFMLEHMSEVSE